MSGVSLKKVRKSFGSSIAVDNVSIDIHEGELVSLLGPSGCGKTTTLRMIAGFVDPTAGSVHFGDREVTRVPVHRRNVGLVFQGYALFPHLTVARNVEFGLKVRRWKEARIEARVREMLEWVQLAQFGQRRPSELSGGQQQRVAVARAMAIQPEVLLLDEPFSALDAKLRLQMRSEIRQLQREAGITSVFVTHDQEEAMAISDRIGVMNKGRLEQIGPAEDLYKHPASRFVAGFIGRCNFIEGRVFGRGCFETACGLVLRFPGERADGPAALCFRPEIGSFIGADANADAHSGVNRMAVSVESVTYLGPLTEFGLVTDAGDALMITTVSSSPGTTFEVGTRCAVTWSIDDSFVVE